MRDKIIIGCDVAKSGGDVSAFVMAKVRPDGQLEILNTKTTNYMDTLEILTSLRHKGAAWQSRDRAEAMMMKLKTHLTEDEWWGLNIAFNHYIIGEGAGEFYEVINKLILKYTKPTQ